MVLIVSDAGHRRKPRKLIFNLLRSLPLLAVGNWNGLGVKKVLLDRISLNRHILVAKPSSSRSSSWAWQRSHDWFTYEMLYERQLSGICAGTRHIAIVFVIASLYNFSQYVFMSHYSLLAIFATVFVITSLYHSSKHLRP